MILLEGLSRRFGAKVAVECLDLEVPRGEFFCFLGPNGAGKTTTIKMITGLLKPSAGRVVVGDFDVASHGVEAKRLLGYIPDHPFLYEKLTGRELLRFVAGLYGLPQAGLAERMEEMLEVFEIRHVADQLVEGYSHGMRQKLSFASTFLHEPRVVVVDEPWVGLDPKNVRRIKTFLKERSRQGLTVFMSTHSLSIAEEVADRVGIFHRGRLLRLGTVEEIRRVADRPDAVAGPLASSLEDVFLQLTRDEDEPALAGAS